MKYANYIESLFESLENYRRIVLLLFLIKMVVIY